MHSRQFRGRGGTPVGGLTGPIPRDIWILLGLILGTFSLDSFAVTRWLPALFELTPLVWRQGFLWQLITYPFVASAQSGGWLLLSLLILFLFGRDVFFQLGRQRFWRLLVYAVGVASLVAVIVALMGIGLAGVPGAPLGVEPFALMQGQRMLITVLVAAFATLNRHATIYLFFVLPIQARWFLWLEILFGFMGFLGSHDLAGFLGICTAVGFTFGHLTSWRHLGDMREVRLRMLQTWLRLRLAWMKRTRGMRVVKDEDKGKNDPWVH